MVMRFPAKNNGGCPKAPRDFPPRKDGILYPRRVVLALPSPSQRLCGRTDVRTITSQPKFLGLIGYQISLSMELRWRALPAGSAIIILLSALVLYHHVSLQTRRCHTISPRFSYSVPKTNEKAMKLRKKY